MTCNCIQDSKINFKISVDQISDTEIIILDRSDWIVPTPAETKFEVTITHPKGGEKKLNLNRSTITSIKSSEFGNTFNDGIYCIEVDSCGILFKQNFALTYKLNCGLVNIAVKDEKAAKEVAQNIKDIHTLVESNYKDKALELYKITEKILAYHNCNCK